MGPVQLKIKTIMQKVLSNDVKVVGSCQAGPGIPGQSVDCVLIGVAKEEISGHGTGVQEGTQRITGKGQDEVPWKSLLSQLQGAQGKSLLYCLGLVFFGSGCFQEEQNVSHPSEMYIQASTVCVHSSLMHLSEVWSDFSSIFCHTLISLVHNTPLHALIILCWICTIPLRLLE